MEAGIGVLAVLGYFYLGREQGRFVSKTDAQTDTSEKGSEVTTPCERKRKGKRQHCPTPVQR